MLRLTDLNFDPILRQTDQPLEPDRVAAKEAIRWRDHLVFVFPIGGQIYRLY